jgi:hypothetical protein
MRLQTILLFFLLSTINFSYANCIQNPFASSKLPKEMPENTTFSFKKNGGMAPTWFKITITDLKILIEEKTLQDKTPKKWIAEISKKEKENLYQFFYKNKFDLVKNDKSKGIVYDAGSEGVSIRAGKISKNVSYGKNSPLSGTNLRRYQAAAAALKSLGKKHQNNLTLIADNFVILKYSPIKHKSFFQDVMKTNLSPIEIKRPDQMIVKARREYNSTKNPNGDLLKLIKYKRQFIPVKTKSGEKVVFANYFCSAPDNWRKELYEIKDGGNCYFQLYVNLKNNDYKNFSVNGLS